jgi:phage terminase large subunit
MSTISVSESVGQGYWGGWFTNRSVWPCRYRVYFGARSTKKSEDIMGREPIFKILDNPIRNIVMVRQNDTDNAQSTYANLVRVIGTLGLEDKFRFYTSPHMIVYRKTGQRIVFRGFNNPQSITSIKFEKGELTDIYIEEASQITDREGFRQMDGSLRGIMPEGVQMQITMALNPWDQQCWIYDEFVKGRMEDDYDYLLTHDYRECYDPTFTRGCGAGLYLHQSTYRINEFRDKTLDPQKELMRTKMPEIYKTECLGMWGNSTEMLLPEWSPKTEVLRPQQLAGLKYCDYAIGIDTGYSDGQGHIRRDGAVKSATVAVLVGLTSDCTKFVALKEWYWTNIGAETPKTVPEILNAIADAIKGWRDCYANDPCLMKGAPKVYVDAADPQFRQNLEMAAPAHGLWGCEYIMSTKIPILSRVGFERLMMGWGDLLVSTDCPNLMREFANARKGEKGEARLDIDDHATNAFEYAWSPMRMEMVRWREFKEH